MKHVQMRSKANIIVFFLASSLFVSGITGAAWLYEKRDISEGLNIDVVTVADLKKTISDGNQVVFIDAREWKEFNEGHIPDAIHLPLREAKNIDSDKVSKFQQADWVVPYCLKDFRGYEVARTLKGKGVLNVRLIKGFGLSAWKKNGGHIQVLKSEG